MAKVIAWILIILLLVGAIGAVAYFTGGFQSEFKTFYVNVDGKDIMTTGSGYEITSDDALTVAVKYTMPDAEKGYTVKVVPNPIPGKDFDFSLDGEVYSFQAEKDLTKGFLIDVKEDSFTIAPKGTTQEVMEAIYPNNAVGGFDTGAYEDMFLIVITAADGGSSVSLAFSIPEKVGGISLHPSHIEF